MNDDRLKALYQKYLHGDCSQVEYQQVKEFLLRMQQASELVDVETVESMTELDIQLDAERSQQMLKQILSQRSAMKQPAYRNYLSYLAAASILLVGFLSLYLVGQRVGYPIYQNTENVIKRIVLPDQSSVYLKPNARITQMSNFDEDDTRRIRLQGEAFFAVHRDKTRPFIVHSSQGLTIRVLGTRFYANFGQNNESVMLTEGAVSVHTDQDKLTLKPQEMVVYQGKGTRLERQTVDTALFNAWIDHQIYFKEQTLFAVIERLNEIYPESHLYIEPSFHHLRFTGYLPNNSLQQAIKILHRAFANHQLTIITRE